MGEFLMPSLGSDMESGTLIGWEKQPGDIVRRGDIIAVVETQKGAIEVEVFEDGVLESQLVEIGKPVPVGTPLAYITSAAETAVVDQEAAVSVSPARHRDVDRSADVPDRAAQQLELERDPDQERERELEVVPSIEPDEERQVVAPGVSTGAEGMRQKITPAARRLAAATGVKVEDLQGTGPQGEIVLDDVRARIPAGETVAPMTAMRSAIAASMSHSKRDIPHYYLAHSIDLSAATQWLQRHNESRAPEHRILMGAVLLKAVATGAVKYPEFNGHYRDGAFEPATAVHAGMAINLRGGGLVAPAIHHVDQLDIDDIMLRMRDLVERVRKGRFRAAELSDPTLTVSSLGERGVDRLYGVIYPPQVAIIGFGTPALRPWVNREGRLEVRNVVEMSLAADHRVSDGHRGALFLRYIQRQLENIGKTGS